MLGSSGDFGILIQLAAAGAIPIANSQAVQFRREPQRSKNLKSQGAKMKRMITLASALLAFCIFAPLAQAENKDQELYGKGKAAFESGNYKVAYEVFTDLVKRHPSHAKIRYYQRNSRLKLLQVAPKAGLEAELQAIKVPEISLEDASLDLAFQFITMKATELSGGEIKANFIYKGPKDEREDPQISLKLTNVPLSEVIRYIGEMTGTHFKFEQHAIVATPIRNLAVPAETQPAPAKTIDPFAPRAKKDDLNPFA
ncbi:MAG: tetratricopeptide (TPR) repeat protein [Verrucomicrobiales bacterium]